VSAETGAARGLDAGNLGKLTHGAKLFTRVVSEAQAPDATVLGPDDLDLVRLTLAGHREDHHFGLRTGWAIHTSTRPERPGLR
jgi:hypothetical protein